MTDGTAVFQVAMTRRGDLLESACFLPKTLRTLLGGVTLNQRRLRDVRNGVSAELGEDERLLRALFQEHGAALWAFVSPLVAGDSGRAQDVVQETMLRAWRRPDILGQQRGSVRSWLFTVARRIIIDQWRHDGSPPGSLELASDLSDPAQAAAVDVMLDQVVVSEALDRLTTAHRQVLRLCYYDGCTTVEAARQLGIPEGTVKSRAHYALEALRLALNEMGVTP